MLRSADGTKARPCSHANRCFELRPVLPRQASQDGRRVYSSPGRTARKRLLDCARRSPVLQDFTWNSVERWPLSMSSSRTSTSDLKFAMTWWTILPHARWIVWVLMAPTPSSRTHTAAPGGREEKPGRRDRVPSATFVVCLSRNRRAAQRCLWMENTWPHGRLPHAPRLHALRKHESCRDRCSTIILIRSLRPRMQGSLTLEGPFGAPPTAVEWKYLEY